MKQIQKLKKKLLFENIIKIAHNLTFCYSKIGEFPILKFERRELFSDRVKLHIDGAAVVADDEPNRTERTQILINFLNCP